MLKLRKFIAAVSAMTVMCSTVPSSGVYAAETAAENDSYPKTIERHINVEFRDEKTHELIPDTSINYWLDYSSHNKGGKVEQPTAVSADNGIYSFDINADIYAPKPDVIRNTSSWLCVEIMDIPENYRDYFTFYNETPKYEIAVWEDMPDDNLYTFYLINDEEWEKLKVIRYGEDIQNINEYTPVTTAFPSEPGTTTTTTVVPLSNLAVIRESLTAFILENDLPAKVVSNEQYPGYQPVVIEYNTDTGVNVGAILLDYIVECNLDRSCIGFVPIVDGVAMTTVNPESILLGDANGDDQVSVSDVVAILQYSANKQKYPIEEQYLANADCYDPGSGVNADDAFAAQQYDAKVISSLPMYSS